MSYVIRRRRYVITPEEKYALSTDTIHGQAAIPYNAYGVDTIPSLRSWIKKNEPLIDKSSFFLAAPVRSARSNSLRRNSEDVKRVQRVHGTPRASLTTRILITKCSLVYALSETAKKQARCCVPAFFVLDIQNRKNCAIFKGKTCKMTK